MPGPDGGRVRVLFARERPGERLEADALGAGEYRLEDVPLFAYGVGYGDVVAAEAREGELVFTRVLRRGPHATYRLTASDRLALDVDGRALLDRVVGLAALRRTYGTDDVALSVPSGPRAREVERLLDEGERRGLWDWECSASPEDEPG